KYNYWLLTVVPLGIDLLSVRVPGGLRWICAHHSKITLRRMTCTAIRDPFVIAAAILSLLDIAIYMHGPAAIDALDRRVSLYPPENLATVIWWVLFIRAALLWRAYRKDIDAFIGFAGRRLLYWHLLPIGVSLLIPKRLSTLLWYIGPTHG